MLRIVRYPEVEDPATMTDKPATSSSMINVQQVMLDQLLTCRQPESCFHCSGHTARHAGARQSTGCPFLAILAQIMPLAACKSSVCLTETGPGPRVKHSAIALLKLQQIVQAANGFNWSEQTAGRAFWILSGAIESNGMLSTVDAAHWLQ